MYGTIFEDHMPLIFCLQVTKEIIFDRNRLFEIEWEDFILWNRLSNQERERDL